MTFTNTTSKRGNQYTACEVLLLTNVIYIDLRTKWENLNWDIEELNFIWSSIDSYCEDFNSIFFTDCQFFYLDQVKNLYCLEKTGWVFIIHSIWKGRLCSVWKR